MNNNDERDYAEEAANLRLMQEVDWDDDMRRLVFVESTDEDRLQGRRIYVLHCTDGTRVVVDELPSDVGIYEGVAAGGEPVFYQYDFE